MRQSERTTTEKSQYSAAIADRLLQPRVCSNIETRGKCKDSVRKLENAVLSRKVRFFPSTAVCYEADFAVPCHPSERAVTCTAWRRIYGRLPALRARLESVLPMSRDCHALRRITGWAGISVARGARRRLQLILLARSAFPKSSVFVVGESAGGGLCYALCLKAKAVGMPLPDGIVTISPWTDLTLSFPSHEKNAKIDPSLSTQLLDFYARLYAPEQRETPFVSPALGDLSGLRIPLIFVAPMSFCRTIPSFWRSGWSKRCRFTLHVEEGAWHAYVLYALMSKTGIKTIQDYIGILYERNRISAMDEAG